MDIVINLTSISNFFSLPMDIMLWRLFTLIGWIPIAIVFLWGAKEIWLGYIRGKWGEENGKYLILAIDIPRGNELSPKAVENFFTYLGGAHATNSLIEEYWDGQYQLCFSLEIVSLEGYTQFLIHTPVKFRDLVESGIYSQYPDAEITEVNDYTENMPRKFPDDEYDIWGSEFIQTNHWSNPIKTYENFEHQDGSKETQFKDPMALLMDLCSSLKRGEQLWFQLIVKPIGFDWPEEGEKEINKILGEKPKITFFNDTIDKIMEWIGAFSEAIYKLWGDIPEEKEDSKDDVFRMMNLKPKEKKQIEAIQEKISKLGFEVKLRAVYIARKEVMNKAKVANGMVGFIKQFALLDLNNLKPDMDMTATRADYFFKERRLNRKKNNIINNYIARDEWAGRLPGVLNIEELATIWHFPVESVVRAPLIQKAPGRKAGPPMELPVGEEIVSEEILDPIFIEEESPSNNISDIIKITKKTDKKKSPSPILKGAPPGNLPLG